LAALRAQCDRTGAQLIFDEIQSGIGRTGQWFAFQHYGVVPDILCTAKALGGGLPLGAFVSSREKMAQLTHHPPLGHITTFGGNPLSCAAALATLESIEEEGLLAQVEHKGQLIESALQHPRVREIRRKGLFFALEFSHADEVQRVVQKALELGVVCFWFLSCPESFRIAPPLNMPEAEIKEACRLIRQAFDALDD
jgi:Ornithine/acetylornithine aminotransferase